MKYLMGLLALLVAACAVAATTSMVDSGYPPPKYQHDGIAAVTFFVGQKKINSICGEAGPGYQTQACAFSGDRKLVLPNACDAEFEGQSFARLVCHEMGHLNGWPGNHPRP